MQSTNPGGQRVLLNLQQAIVHALENQENSGGFDGRTDTKFIADTWERPEGGGGRSCVLSGGQVIEKQASCLAIFISSRCLLLRQYATLSWLVLKHKHWGSLWLSTPKPYVPTSHANVRLFVATPTDGSAPIWWFGGGFDLTPFIQISMMSSIGIRWLMSYVSLLAMKFIPSIKLGAMNIFILNIVMSVVAWVGCFMMT